MELHVNIKNLGRLTDADIRFRDFTVLAGLNNTGKSFVSKTLYSLFNAMHVEPISEIMGKNIADTRRYLRLMTTRFAPEHSELIGEFRKDMESRLLRLAEFSKFDPTVNLDERIQSFNSTQDEREVAAKEMLDFFRTRTVALRAIRKTPYDGSLDISFGELMKRFRKDAQSLIHDGLSARFEINLLSNFQIEHMGYLRGNSADAAEIALGDLGKFSINETGCDFFVTSEGLLQMQKFSRVIYLESPIYWKLKDALEMGYFRARGGVGIGVPHYFYDLMAEIRDIKVGKSKCADLHKRIADAIGGKLVVTESTDFLFEEMERGSFPLPVTAMGVANFGMLGLLIEKGIIDQDTSLFIDEPEAHLHPAWQVEMVKVLFDLARQGVNVVIATHSVDILKWIEETVEKEPESKDIIALNHFSTDGTVTGNGNNFVHDLSAIQQELTQPYHKLYMGDV